MQLTTLRVAADRDGRWADMTAWTVFLSMLLGAMWHVLLFALMGGPITNAISWTLLAGALAGLSAGHLTLRSRARRQSRENIRDGLLTYYAAVLTYALASVLIAAVAEAVAGEARLGILELLAASCAMCGYAVLFATVMGVVLVPLCFATRLLFWHVSGRMRPN